MSLKHFDIINIDRVIYRQATDGTLRATQVEKQCRESGPLCGWTLASRDRLKAVAAVTRSHDMVTFEHLFEVADDTVEWRVRPRHSDNWN